MDKKIARRLAETVEELAKAMMWIRHRKGEWQDEPSMTLEEAARFLAVHPNRMREFNRMGLSHFKGVAKSITYLRSDLIRWRENYRVQPVNKPASKFGKKVLPLTQGKAS